MFKVVTDLWIVKNTESIVIVHSLLLILEWGFECVHISKVLNSKSLQHQVTTGNRRFLSCSSAIVLAGVNSNDNGIARISFCIVSGL